MRIQLIGKPEPALTGISRYTENLYQGLLATGVDTHLTFPIQVPIPVSIQRGLMRIGLDARAFFANYPFRAKLENADIYHLTGQMLATLLLFQRFPRPVVVSVLDIIPYLVQHDRELNTLRHPSDRVFYRMALMGLRRANALIAISEYTKQTLIDALRLPAERIHVVYPAVNHEMFRPMPISGPFRAKYGLDEGKHYILFVGSEDPRKNMRTLLRAFELVKSRLPNSKLLKVGSSHFPQERQKLLCLIAELSLEQDVLLFDDVLDQDLPSFYNVADVFVMPSFYEGFGLPLVEAMACGTPVIYARAGSLPEVGDGSGIQVYPHDENALADALIMLLQSPEERLRLGQAGYQRAARFNWTRTACEVQRIYASLRANER